MSELKNRCRLTEAGVFQCTVDWDVEHGPTLCKFQLQEIVPVDCDFLFQPTRACSSRRAHCEAARTAANASIEKAKRDTDKVLDALNRLWSSMVNEDKSGGGEGGGDA